MSAMVQNEAHEYPDDCSEISDPSLASSKEGPSSSSSTSSLDAEMDVANLLSSLKQVGKTENSMISTFWHLFSQQNNNIKKVALFYVVVV